MKRIRKINLCRSPYIIHEDTQEEISDSEYALQKYKLYASRVTSIVPMFVFRTTTGYLSTVFDDFWAMEIDARQRLTIISRGKVIVLMNSPF